MAIVVTPQGVGQAKASTLVYSPVFTPTVGNWIIVILASDTTIESVTPSNWTATFVKDAEAANSGNVITSIWSGKVTAVSIPGALNGYNVNADAKCISVYEVTGLADTPFDKSKTAVNTGTAPSSTATDALTQADELIIGGIGLEGPNGDTPGTWTTGASYVSGNEQRLGTTGAGAASNITVMSAAEVVAATTAQTAAATLTTGRDWAAAIATYKAPSGATSYQTIPATASGVSVLSKLPGKVLSATVTGSAVLSRLNSFYRTLTSAITGVSVLTKGMYKTLTSTVTGIGVLSTVKMFIKALDAVTQGITELTKEFIAGAGQTFYQTLNAIVCGIANIGNEPPPEITGYTLPAATDGYPVGEFGDTTVFIVFGNENQPYFDIETLTGRTLKAVPDTLSMMAFFHQTILLSESDAYIFHDTSIPSLCVAVDRYDLSQTPVGHTSTNTFGDSDSRFLSALVTPGGKLLFTWYQWKYNDPSGLDVGFAYRNSSGWQTIGYTRLASFDAIWTLGVLCVHPSDNSIWAFYEHDGGGPTCAIKLVESGETISIDTEYDPFIPEESPDDDTQSDDWSFPYAVPDSENGHIILAFNNHHDRYDWQADPYIWGTNPSLVNVESNGDWALSGIVDTLSYGKGRSPTPIKLINNNLYSVLAHVNTTRMDWADLYLYKNGIPTFIDRMSQSKNGNENVPLLISSKWVIYGGYPDGYVKFYPFYSGITKIFSRVLNTTATGISTLTKKMYKTISAMAVGSAVLTTAKIFIKTLEAMATGVVNLTKGMYKTLSATTTGVGVLSKALSLYRTLSSTVTGVSVLTKTATHYLTLAGTVVGTGVLATVTTFKRTLNAMASGLSNLVAEFISGGITGETYYQTLNAITQGMAALSKVPTFVQTYYKTLSATITGTVILSKASTFYRTLTSTFTSIALLTYHPGWILRIFSYFASKEISITSSITRPLSISSVITGGLSMTSSFSKGLRVNSAIIVGLDITSIIGG